MSTVVVAMSGGVDSSVTAALMVEQGHEVIGVHMKLHPGSPVGGTGHCCGLEDAFDARKVADQLGIPFYVMNLQEAFKQAVMDDFADAYVAGFTPNPCVRCNGVLKFKVLLARARALGADYLATGHYARIADVGNGPRLFASENRKKDQSYFLFPMTKEALEMTLFPLDGLSKEAVRGVGKRLDLVTANKAESQDVCFIPDDDHARFVREWRPDTDGAGEIVDGDGNILGHHDGYFRYTVGQRRGLGVALGRPAYVIAIDPDTCRVTIGNEEELKHIGLWAKDFTWHDRPNPDHVVAARIRHRGRLIPCRVGDGDPCRVDFLEAGRAVAPGQAVVFYEGDQVLGGGWIERAIRHKPLMATAHQHEGRV